jgi:hypothetical protein
MNDQTIVVVGASSGIGRAGALAAQAAPLFANGFINGATVNIDGGQRHA